MHPGSRCELECLLVSLALGPLCVLAFAAGEEPTYQQSIDETTGLATDRKVMVYPHGSATPPEDLAPYAAYSVDDPKAAFDLERAAQFIDSAAVKWGSKHGCVTCHTNGHYLMVPAEVFKGRIAAQDVRDFAEEWVDSWDEIGLPDTEIVVAPSAFLAINNMQMDGKLRPATIKALDETWVQQSVEGHWANWVKCNWPPFEQDDHYGVTLVAVAMGMAPKSYTSIEPARTGIQRLLNYLSNNEPEEVHHRAMMLWAGKYHDSLLSDATRQKWIEELWALQKSSGGWASGDLGRWRQIDGGPEEPPVMVDPNGDGYGTGFVLYVLIQAGVPASDPGIQKGIEWLKVNQHADGKWFTNSLRNEVWTSHFLTHAGTTWALKALAAAGITGDAGETTVAQSD